MQCRACGEDNSADAGPSTVVSHPEYYDRLGDWSQIKHDILEQYALAYTKIVDNQSVRFEKVYIDGFAGAGVAVDRASEQLVAGSAYRMLLNVQPAFDRYHFIELDPVKIASLRRRFGRDPRVHIHHGDSNEILLTEVLPTCQWNKYVRALCLLDPYGLSVSWDVLKAIAATRTTEIFFNFMVESANRNVLWADLAAVPESRRKLMRFVWGDDSWIDAAYQRVPTLFDDRSEKIPGNEALISAYRLRLERDAGFKYVPHPIPMKNSRNATVYYLFFASPNATGKKIVEHIFGKHRRA